MSRSLTQNVLDLLAFTTSEKERIAGAARHEGEFRLATGETVRIRFSSYEHAFTDEEREGLTIARAALDKALGQTRAAGAHFLAVHVPTKLAVYRDLCRFGDDAPPSTWEVPATGPWLAAWCRENEVAFLDLQTALDEAAARGELTYYVADLHWNARGNDVAARAIADRLTATGWLTD